MHNRILGATFGDCPVCGGPGELVEKLRAADSRIALHRLFGDASAQNLQFPDYILCACRLCTLGYASPLIPGDGNFYTWLTAQTAYYNDARWEWLKVAELVRGEIGQRGGVVLADLGCGSGQFLKSLPAAGDCRYIGIDSSSVSVTAGRAAGLDVHLGDWDVLRDLCPTGLDFITGFHCLEHLPDPVAFVRNCSQLLRSTGRLFVSTPLYPSSTEEGWRDPLNAPPHHLTRWNIKAVHALAEAADCEVRIHLPSAASLLVRTLRIYRFALSLPFASLGVSRRRRILSSALGALVHPWIAAKLLITQVVRRRIDGKVAPDVVLMEFRPRQNEDLAATA